MLIPCDGASNSDSFAFLARIIIIKIKDYQMEGRSIEEANKN